MRIVIGCDHHGLEIKKAIIQFVTQAGHSCEDKGSYTTESVDYPDIAREVAEAVARGSFDCGILICGTGIGMSIAANKIRGIRAALCRDTFSATRTRQHNDANVLCLSAQDSPEALTGIVKTFLADKFQGGRHLRRVNKIRAMEG